MFRFLSLAAASTLFAPSVLGGFVSHGDIVCDTITDNDATFEVCGRRDEQFPFGKAGEFSNTWFFFEGLEEGTRLYQIDPAVMEAASTGLEIYARLNPARKFCRIEVNGERCKSCTHCGRGRFSADCTNIEHGRTTQCEAGLDENIFFPLTIEALGDNVPTALPVPSASPAPTPTTPSPTLPHGSFRPSHSFDNLTMQPTSETASSLIPSSTIFSSTGPSVSSSFSSAGPSVSSSFSSTGPSVSSSFSSSFSSTGPSATEASVSSQGSNDLSPDAPDTCASLSACYLAQLSDDNSKVEGETLLLGDGETAYATVQGKDYSIRCDTTTDGELNRMDFSWSDGDESRTEWGADYWMGGDFDGRVYDVPYLKTCGTKEVTVVGAVWRGECFRETFTLTQTEC